MKISILLLFCCLLGCFSITGQIDTLSISTKDTLSQQAVALPTQVTNLAKQKPIFVLNLDIRHSFVRNSPITIYGGYVGLKLKNKHLFSIGYYTLSDSSKVRFKQQNQQQGGVSDEVSLWFLSFGYTYTFYQNSLLKFDIPVEVGVGAGSQGIYDKNDKILRLTQSTLVPLQMGLSANVFLTRWFGLHLQAGYRNMLGQSLFENQYSGIYYTYGISLNFGRILADIRR